MKCSWLITIIVLLNTVPQFGVMARTQNGSSERLKKLKYRECGRKYKKAIEIQKLDLLPMPIEIPGRIQLRLLANVTGTFPNNVDIKLSLKKKYFNSLWMKLPCLNGYGSCKYKDIPTCLVTNEIFGCPVEQKFYDIDQVLTLEDPGKMARQIMAGEYRATVKVKHPITRKVLACMNGHFSVMDSNDKEAENELN